MKLSFGLTLKPHEKYVLRRKFTHISGVTYVFCIWFFTELFGFSLAVMLLVAIVMFMMSIYVAYNFLKFLGIHVKSLGKLWKTFGSPEFLNGEEYYWDVCWLGLFLSISIVLSLLVADVRIAYVMACTVILGDGFAGVVGTIAGKHRIPINPKKTFEGHISGFLVAFVVSYMLTQSFLMSLIGTGVGMIVEALPSKISDNATVPISTTLVLIFLKFVFGGFL
ncbi:hypothetical protein DRO26_02575 [Candidatus Bathyarchaeota archaeon]|nr:MAG: hypothetical protein DRO26_02575 [Candidatus Bathyarchaeota archaeon]